MYPILDGYGVMTVFNSRTRPRENRVLQLAGSLVANFSQLQTMQFPTTRAVHNRATACVVAGVGIFENQL